MSTIDDWVITTRVEIHMDVLYVGDDLSRDELIDAARVKANEALAKLGRKTCELFLRRAEWRGDNRMALFFSE